MRACGLKRLIRDGLGVRSQVFSEDGGKIEASRVISRLDPDSPRREEVS